MPSGTATVPAYTPLSIPATETLAENTANQDLGASIGLEQEYAPNLYNATQAYQGQLGTNIADIQPIQNLVNQGAATVSGNVGYTPTPLNLPTLGVNPVQAQVNQVVGANLANPGALPADVAAQIRASTGNAGGAGGVLGGAGAPANAAANLGLNSIQLQNMNIAQGNQVGQQQQALNLTQQSMANQIAQYNQQLQQANMARQASTTQQLANLVAPLQTSMGLVGNTPLPASGLSPSAVASLAVGNNNAQNQYAQNAAGLQNQAQNNMWGFYGGLIDAALGAGGSAIQGLNTGGGSSFGATPTAANPAAGGNPSGWLSPSSNFGVAPTLNPWGTS